MGPPGVGYQQLAEKLHHQQQEHGNLCQQPVHEEAARWTGLAAGPAISPKPAQPAALA